MNLPEAGPPDPHFRTVTGKNVPAEGIDLDGQDSHANGKAAPGLCPHEDFRGLNGERGIDNQFFRLVGCSKAFQSTGPYSEFDVGMYTGSWGLLMTLKGVNDLRNAKDVEVGFYTYLHLSFALELLLTAPAMAGQIVVALGASAAPVSKDQLADI
jgi:hypothetical protein